MKPWILLRLAALAAGAFIGGCSYDSSTYLPPPSPVTVTLSYGPSQRQGTIDDCVASPSGGLVCSQF